LTHDRFWRLVRIATDSVMAMVALALAYWLRFHVYPTGNIPSGEPPDPKHYVLAAPVVAACVIGVFSIMGEYRGRRGVQFVDELFSLIGAMAVTGLVVFTLVGLYREPGFLSYSRLTFIYWEVLAFLLIAFARYATRRVEAARRARGIGADRAIVVGSGASAGLLIQRMRMFPDYGYRLVGVLADELEPGHRFAGVPVLGTTDDLARMVEMKNAHVVFVAMPHLDPDRLLSLIDRCRELDVEFRILPRMLELMTTGITVDQLGGVPLLQLRRGLPFDSPRVALKRAFDLVVAGAGLVVMAPVMGLLVLGVRLSSPGPVLLHQERVGMNGTCFRMHKFRTMRPDAESDSGPVWAEPSDPRRTPFGRFLRRFSLDELPQLWNILAGDMSLVGPRAERPVFVEEFGSRLERYQDRLSVRPGLTGWAQANDLRGNTPVEERLIYDLYYIENWSLAFDLKIILVTLFRIFTHKNAY
jgi:exopolysaccharide biosynthesis polyprenyl glycosylphosphotransferase